MAQGTVLLPFNYGAYSSPNSCILNGVTSASPNSAWALTAGDQLNLVLYPRTTTGVAGASSITQQLPAGCSIVITGKVSTALDATTLLFKAINFTQAQDGNNNWTYTGYLDLKTDELAAAITTNQPSIQVMLIIEIIDATGSPQRFLAYITIYNECYSGSEGNPTPATPAFLTASQTQLGFVNNWNFVTDIGGGTATSLNFQPTAGVIAFGTQVGMRGIAAINGGGYTLWEYQNRTDASGPGLQQPLDFNAISNAGVWTQLL